MYKVFKEPISKDHCEYNSQLGIEIKMMTFRKWQETFMQAFHPSDL